MPPLREIRHQAAVVRDHHILLIHARDQREDSFWLLPGGGSEGSETGEECVCREVREETHLDVTVVRTLLDEVVPPNDLYHRVRTYLCSANPEAIASPGEEPEEYFTATILEARWFDLRSFDAWPEKALSNPRTMDWSRKVRTALEYETELAST
ncbi:MAG: NUDIX domain-containing protein [Dehalococcoidia bacterium]